MYATSQHTRLETTPTSAEKVKLRRCLFCGPIRDKWVCFAESIFRSVHVFPGGCSCSWTLLQHLAATAGLWSEAARQGIVNTNQAGGSDLIGSSKAEFKTARCWKTSARIQLSALFSLVIGDFQDKFDLQTAWKRWRRLFCCCVAETFIG